MKDLTILLQRHEELHKTAERR